MSNLNNNLYQAQPSAAERVVSLRKAFSMVGVFTLMMVLWFTAMKVPFDDPMTFMVAPFFIAIYIVAVRRVMEFGNFDAPNSEVASK